MPINDVYFLSPTLFNIYIDDAMDKRQNTLLVNYKIDDFTLNTMLFVGDQIVLVRSEDDLQRGLYVRSEVAEYYNLRISHTKTKVMAFRGCESLRAKIIISDKLVEQINKFCYLGCDATYAYSNDCINKLQKFQYLHNKMEQ